MATIWDYRSLIWNQVIADLRGRYAGSAGGFLWVFMQPIGMIVIYSLVFSHIMTVRLAGVSHDSMSYVVYLCSGLIIWTGFAECVMRGSCAMIENATSIRKVALPEEVPVARVAVSSLVTMSIGYLILCGFVVPFGVMPSVIWLLLPLPMLLITAFGYGLALSLAVMVVFFRDIAQAVGMLLPLVMWTVPIVYVPDILPSRLRDWLPYHPLHPFIESIRSIMLSSKMPAGGDLIAMLLWTGGSLLVGILILRSARTEIKDAV